MQMWIYFVSFFLPPFGLGLTIKYLKAKDDKVRIVGFISLGLTIVALILAIILSLSFLKTVNQLIPKELNQFETIGL